MHLQLARLAWALRLGARVANLAALAAKACPLCARAAEESVQCPVALLPIVLRVYTTHNSWVILGSWEGVKMMLRQGRKRWHQHDRLDYLTAKSIYE